MTLVTIRLSVSFHLKDRCAEPPMSLPSQAGSATQICSGFHNVTSTTPAESLCVALLFARLAGYAERNR